MVSRLLTAPIDVEVATAISLLKSPNVGLPQTMTSFADRRKEHAFLCAEDNFVGSAEHLCHRNDVSGLVF